MSAARTVAIPAGDGQTFDGWLYAAPQGRAPGLVMIPEIFGANAPLREIADRKSTRLNSSH